MNPPPGCALKFFLAVVLALVLTGASANAATGEVLIDPASPGRVFEGIGALSAGASSRLLLDYPEPQRRQVLDLLFKPSFAASLHHLKVEIGGDVNSTDGTEPSHARTRQEFEGPRPDALDRGYEWWLMREAKRRKPDIFLDVLQWGAPGWIGGRGDNRRKFYSQDNADFIVSFIQAARQRHAVDIDFCGIWNENPRENDWIKLLRRTLDTNGLARVKIIAPDEVGTRSWLIANDMLADRELMDAVHAIGVHYVGSRTTAEAIQTGKPLWSSEDGPWRGDWEGVRALAKAFNRNYVLGRMTKTIIWSLVTSYYDVLPLPDSGPMKAKEPWSGHFEVQPGLWSIAHTTQFAQPGWRYLDRACGVLSQGGSVVTLVGPDTNAEVSVIIETMDATVPQTVAFRLWAGAPVKALRVWRSTERSQFDRLPDVDVAEGRFTITVEPDAIYSLTTTRGQNKGQYAAPRSREFPLPYMDNFEAYTPGKYARYFSDQGGVFEVSRRPDDAGQCLRQVIPQNGIDWHYHPTPEPHSLLGAVTWRNYAVHCDVRVEQAGSASIGGRISCSPQTADPAHGYRLELNTAGRWSLHSFTNVVAQGDAAFAADRWHRVELRFAGARISGLLDGARLFELADFNEQRGLAALGTGWNTACFDNFAVQPVPANEVVEPVNLVRGATLSASSQVPEGLEAWRAGDRRGETRWLAAPGPGLGEWLQIDFGKPARVGAVHVRQFERRIEKYRIQHWDGSQWVDCVTREQREMPEWTDVFPTVQTARLRLYVLGTKKGLAPSIWEIEAYDTGGAGAASPAKP